MKQTVIALLIALLFSGCKTGNKVTGRVIDSPVEGMEYQCAGLINYTPNDGTVSCKHMPLGFKIGEIRLGSMLKMPSDGYILPQDILGVKRSDVYNENVVKLAVILQSLDSDHNPENGITITKEVREKLKTPINIKKMSLEEIEELIELQLNQPLFQTPQEAIKHLKRSMKKYKIVK